MKFFSALLDLYAPTRCAACLAPWPVFPAKAPSLCAACASTLEPAAPATDGVLAAYEHGGALAQAIHRAKYGATPFVARTLAGLFAHSLEHVDPDEVLVPVPLHRERLRTRGFNQAVELLRHVRADRCLDALERQRATPQQVRLGRSERLVNVAGSMRVRRPDAVEGKRVLLVDDVVTTGATLAEAQRALRSAGAAEVRSAALARAVLKSVPEAKESL